jgi:hypothetical protein
LHVGAPAAAPEKPAAQAAASRIIHHVDVIDRSSSFVLSQPAVPLKIRG